MQKNLNVINARTYLEGGWTIKDIYELVLLERNILIQEVILNCQKQFFELLEENDIYVAKHDRFYPYFASYDLEAMMKHVSHFQGKT